MAGQERRLVLVRHSLPEFVTGVPASEWHLSAEGRRRCEILAGRLAACELAAVVSSEEPKAVETGLIVAETLGLHVETAAGLHEHKRGLVQDVGSREDFEAQVTCLFERPRELVFGRETADQAHARFARAIAHTIERHTAGDLAIVSHGTVITLFTARIAGLDPLPFWKGLGLPCFVVHSLPDLDLLEVVADVEAEEHSTELIGRPKPSILSP